MRFKQLLERSYSRSDYFAIDLSVDNPHWDEHDITDVEVFEAYLNLQRRVTGKYIAYGGYLEQRSLYKNSSRFNDETIRDIHLGLDLWAPTGTAVHPYMDGRVHSYSNNLGSGNYGPTIILEHQVGVEKIYSLYGHLSLDSIYGLKVGLRFRESETLARLGSTKVNGGYSPHLHFQLMTTMDGYTGDFPGVCTINEIAKYQRIIKDPLKAIHLI
ncbi:MAG: peptidoglycan DD-metalloendopeptidase family protein [Nonlabens sp.]